MGIERTHGTSFDLGVLLASVERGAIVLPEFQRDFVWETTDVKKLLASCLTGWPIGSLLTLPGRSKPFFKVRAIKGAPPAQQPYELIVLDGQQRLTSLYQSMYGRGDFRYGIEFRRLSDSETIEELEESIVDYPAEKWLRRFPDPRSEYLAGVLPVTILRSAAEFFLWRDTAVPIEDSIGRALITKIYVDKLSGFDRYQIPAVVIDDTVHPEAIARIFERVNRLGEPLGTFDLMVAKSFSDGFNLREEWESAQEQFPRLAEFLRRDGLPVLSVMSLYQRRSLRQQDVLALTGPSVRDYWHRSVAAVDAAIDFAERRLGVWSSDFLPYKAQLSILGCLAMQDALPSESARIESWFWNSVFRARYEIASNTRAVEDLELLLAGTDVFTGPTLVDPETMLSSNRRQYGALHRGLLCLFAAAGPLDPFDGLDAPVDKLDAVPVSFLSREPHGEISGHLLTLGMMLTTKRSSRGHGTVALGDVRPKVLTSQLLPENAADVDVREVLSARMDKIAEVLAKFARTSVHLVAPEEVSAQ